MTNSERFRRDMRRAFIRITGAAVIPNEHQPVEDILSATKANLALEKVNGQWIFYPITETPGSVSLGLTAERLNKVGHKGEPKR